MWNLTMNYERKRGILNELFNALLKHTKKGAHFFFLCSLYNSIRADSWFLTCSLRARNIRMDNSILWPGFLFRRRVEPPLATRYSIIPVIRGNWNLLALRGIRSYYSRAPVTSSLFSLERDIRRNAVAIQSSRISRADLPPPRSFPVLMIDSRVIRRSVA